MIKLIIKAARQCFTPKTPGEIIRDTLAKKARRDFHALRQAGDISTQEDREKLSLAVQSIWLAGGLEGAGISHEAWVAKTGFLFPRDEDIIRGERAIGIKFRRPQPI